MAAAMKKMSPQAREALLLKLLIQVFEHRISEGELLSTLRKQVLGLNQTQYAALVGISRRTLSNVERNAGSQTLTVLNAVFKPLGLRAGLLPGSVSLTEKMVATLQAAGGDDKSKNSEVAA